ncbi:hypothetical protein EIN_397030 [Entamoeba invadens IP1]|uniref:RRM domain-containing protein n=1 Tax=Entamoeba invadens IP1 TaxID=370355 RepID=A0A0A1U9V2_ENTIV|nr:hypothetical protein EIN_397030 [Entamoeba invadens IP1]ELP91843.1 hypothetical protein EIN_397030 [Entamoeba invadens IP1]|eukprot:XP_004258614.1 hypothetical protein EIN_397030 [Entamoeba invadens IP1]
MRPSFYYFPSTYLNSLNPIKTQEQTAPTIVRKSHEKGVAFPRLSIIDTPINNSLRQPQVRRTSVYSSVGPLSVSPKEKTENTVVVKNVPLPALGRVSEELRKNGRIEALNQLPNGDVRVVFNTSESARKAISCGLVSTSNTDFHVNGINTFGEEYGCGDVIQFTARKNFSFWEFILSLFGLN